MNKIIKSRWFIFVFWIAIAILLKTSMPDVDKLVLEKGQPKIPDNYPVTIARSITKELNNQKADSQETSLLAVFHGSKPLTDEQITDIKSGVDKLKNDEEKLKISNILTHFDNKNLEDQMVSKDKTTVLVGMNVDKKDTEIGKITDQIESEFSGVSTAHYITGSEVINDGYVNTLHSASKKTEIFTYLIIFIILLIVFRSILAPVISLLTIGITFIASMGIVTQLVDKFNFPFSSITQTFLTLVLFGIGTDYSILLLMRYKEELKNNSVNDAIINTYKTAGKTVIFSAITVFIGFAVLALANFSVFRSASAVAIAVCILLLELVTLLPFFMKVFGKKLFWPSKVAEGHKQSKLWSMVSSISVKHPVIFLLIAIGVTTPVILLYSHNLSYDMLGEVDPSYDAVKAVNIVSDSFGKGTAFPVNIVLKNKDRLDNNESLANIDRISDAIKKVAGVQSVYSVTRPKGEIIPELYVNDQTKQVNDGLNTANDGIKTIKDGLNDADKKLPGEVDISKVDSLISGTKTVHEKLNEVSDALSKIESGIKNGAGGAAEINNGISQVKESMDKISTSTDQLSRSYSSLQSGFALMGNKYDLIEQQIGLIQTSLTNINSYAAKLVQSYPQIKNDPSYIGLTKTASALATQTEQLEKGFSELNLTYKKTVESFGTANTGLNQITGGQRQIASGLEKLQTGAESLSGGLSTAGDGQSKVIENLPTLTDGLSQITDGQSQLKDGLNTLGSSMPQLKDGLSKSTDGLNDVSKGLDKANSYLAELSKSTDAKTFYIPQDTLKGDDFKESLDSYMSNNFKLTKLMVNLSIDPYSEKAIDVVDNINRAIEQQIKGTNLADCEIGIDGVASGNRDLNTVSTGDLSRSKIIMLIGIAIVLIFITKSIFKPACIIASLIISYYASISATQFIFDKILHRGDLSWSVPFFTFIMIVALGVDYSIFLITRFNEYKDMDPKTAIVKSSANIGGVIMSAAVILSGTFAALYPANMATQIELATAVIIGLFLLAVIFLPIFLPAMISLGSKVAHKKLTTDKAA